MMMMMMMMMMSCSSCDQDSLDRAVVQAISVTLVSQDHKAFKDSQVSLGV